MGRMWGESGADVGRVCRDSAEPSEINEGESVSISGKPHLRLSRQVYATPGQSGCQETISRFWQYSMASRLTVNSFAFPFTTAHTWPVRTS